MQLLQPQLPFVRFEMVTEEKVDLSGHPTYKDVIYAYVTPAGGKDEVVKIADEWITDLLAKSRMADPFGKPNEYVAWHEHFSKALTAFKAGEEMDYPGTPLRTCMAFLKSEVKQCENARIRTLEDLANINEQGLGQLGMNGRNLKLKAQKILETKAGTDHAEEIVALRQQVEDLKTMVANMKSAGMEETQPNNEIAELRAMVMQMAQAKKPGRPAKAA